jgi:8-oxo-dGTP diphosphatase
MKSEKLKANINAYLLLQQDSRILLSLRQNTGYEDGRYSLVAGHVEYGETPTQAMIREAQEEIGIHIQAHDLCVVHTMYRKTNRDNLDLFFTCKQWFGEIRNCEPDKCGGVAFFSPFQLPQNTVSYIKYALSNVQNGVHYSEFSAS